MCDYYLESAQFSLAVLLGISLGRKIPVADGKELSPNVDDICAGHWNELLVRQTRRKADKEGKL